VFHKQGSAVPARTCHSDNAASGVCCRSGQILPLLCSLIIHFYLRYHYCHGIVYSMRSRLRSRPDHNFLIFGISFLLFSSRDELETSYSKGIFPCTSYVPPNRLLWCFGLFGST
jgi:hypothetical protein